MKNGIKNNINTLKNNDNIVFFDINDFEYDYYSKRIYLNKDINEELGESFYIDFQQKEVDSSLIDQGDISEITEALVISCCVEYNNDNQNKYQIGGDFIDPSMILDKYKFINYIDSKLKNLANYKNIDFKINIDKKTLNKIYQTIIDEFYNIFNHSQSFIKNNINEISIEYKKKLKELNKYKDLEIFNSENNISKNGLKIKCLEFNKDTSILNDRDSSSILSIKGFNINDIYSDGVKSKQDGEILKLYFKKLQNENYLISDTTIYRFNEKTDINTIKNINKELKLNAKNIIIDEENFIVSINTNGNLINTSEDIGNIVDDIFTFNKYVQEIDNKKARIKFIDHFLKSIDECSAIIKEIFTYEEIEEIKNKKIVLFIYNKNKDKVKLLNKENLKNYDINNEDVIINLDTLNILSNTPEFDKKTPAQKKSLLTLQKLKYAVKDKKLINDLSQEDLFKLYFGYDYNNIKDKGFIKILDENGIIKTIHPTKIENSKIYWKNEGNGIYEELGFEKIKRVGRFNFK